MLTVGSLFAGIGGFDLAARWMGWRTAWVSEIDPFACQVLARHFPDALNHGDIRHIDFTKVEPIDVLVGGFPCQDISHAGEKKGIEGERSGLWFEYARAIRELRPRYVVVENVRALVNNGLDRVLGSLADIGYDAEWGCFKAADVGAPHQRDRAWILAYPQRTGLEGHGRTAHDETGRAQPTRSIAAHGVPRGTDSIPWWSSEPAMGGTPHGVPRGLAVAEWEIGIPRVLPHVTQYRERLTALGNAIVPQCALVIYREIADRESFITPYRPEYP